MKKNPHTKRIPLLASLAAVLAITLSSCIIEPDEWWSGPPTGWNTFNDTRLTGHWQLVQYNSEPVYTNDANYLYFNGNGAGLYYYLINGYRQVESIRYWSQNSNSGTSYYQINIQYEYDSPVTENYWFTHGGNTLWFQWRTSQGVQTSVYDRIPRAPW